MMRLLTRTLLLLAALAPWAAAQPARPDRSLPAPQPAHAPAHAEPVSESDAGEGGHLPERALSPRG